jgi:hypothetical protein
MPTRKKSAVSTPAVMQQTTSQNIMLNTSVGRELYFALVAYAKDKGLRKPQDALRVASTLMMKQEGFME